MIDPRGEPLKAARPLDDDGIAIEVIYHVVHSVGPDFLRVVSHNHLVFSLSPRHAVRSAFHLLKLCYDFIVVVEQSAMNVSLLNGLVAFNGFCQACKGFIDFAIVCQCMHNRIAWQVCQCV